MFDTSKTEKISPEYWRNSHLSIARFYGRCNINGVEYILDSETDYLIRKDIWRSELKHSKEKAKAEKEKWEKKQGDLFG